jgi:hypothetical protein
MPSRATWLRDLRSCAQSGAITADCDNQLTLISKALVETL